MNNQAGIPEERGEFANKEPERGKLKIFFGMAAGVGKTYAMLQEAHERLQEGADVIIGMVDTHGRPETETIITEFETAPRITVPNETAGKLFELDLDAILERKPSLVLIDDLAHNNAECCRHTKRYQDVEELLEAGIDVFSTLNVQHLDSRADTVRQITGLEVDDTIPDSVFEGADDIELVDISPDELLERLDEGKVDLPDTTEEFTKTFFRKGNLTALREMALRLTAERVDQELRDYKQEQHIEETWKSGERLMVAVSSSPFSEALIRWTRRTAYTMDASWIALSVETSKPLTEQDKNRLTKNLQLAEELGAEIMHVTDDNIVRGILRVARQENVSQVVIGKPQKQRLWGRIKAVFQGGTVVDRLIQESGTIDIYAVRVDAQDVPKEEQTMDVPVLHSDMRQYIITVCLAVMAALVCFVMFSSGLVNHHTVGTLLLFVTTLLALFFGRGPVLLASIVSATIWDYFFIPPQFSFSLGTLDDMLMMAMFLIVAVVASILTSRARSQERAVRLREDRAEVFINLAENLMNVGSVGDVLELVVEQIHDTFQAEVVIFLAQDQESLKPFAEQCSSFHPTPKEISVAAWVFHNHKNAGKFTGTHPTAQALYMPIMYSGVVLGVIGTRFSNISVLPIEQERLLEGFVLQAASAMEREFARAKTMEHQLVNVDTILSSEVVDNIVESVSQPLTVIQSSVRALMVSEMMEDQEVRQALQSDMMSSVAQIQRLIVSLGDLSTLERSAIHLYKEWCVVADEIRSVLEPMKKEMALHPLEIHLPDTIPQIKTDLTILHKILHHILHNAFTYSPPGAPVEILGEYTGTSLALRVFDDGPGISPGYIPRLVEKFFRTPNARHLAGAGLGLYITRSYLDIVKGNLIIENREKGGLAVTLLIPAEHRAATHSIEKG